MSPEEVDVKRVDRVPPPPAPGNMGRQIQRTGCGWLLLKWVMYALAIWLTAWLLQPHVQVAGFGRAMVVALVLGLLNALIRPVLIVLTLPITLLTMGLFLIVINAMMLLLAQWLLEGFDIENFGWALLAAIIISVANLVLDKFLEGLAGRNSRS